MKARAVTIDATILFADLRGYTTLTQTIAQDGLTSLLDAFYDDCAVAIWRYDGILNKTIGDAVFAIFNFPVRRDDHAVQALLAPATSSVAFRNGTTLWCGRSARATSSSALESGWTAATPILVSSAKPIAI